MVWKRILKLKEKMRFARQENRTIERIREHYKIEKDLAKKLRNSTRDERRHLYAQLYNELFRRVPDHPQLTRKTDMDARQRAVSRQMSLLKRFLSKDVCFLEIGAGDCSLSFEVAKHVRKVIAIDISEEISKADSHPKNFTLVISYGPSINAPRNSVNVAYSNQLIEHLHPDDVIVRLRDTHTALALGGVYICITPHRFSGPHDVSMYFDEVATGLHLKEYTFSELSYLLRKVGFSRMYAIWGIRGTYLYMIPLGGFIFLENMLDRIPFKIRRKISRLLPLTLVLGSIRLVATK